MAAAKPFPAHFLVGCGTLVVALMACGSCSGGGYFFSEGAKYDRRAATARYSRYSILGPAYYARKASTYKAYGTIGVGTGLVMLLVTIGMGIGAGAMMKRYNAKVREAEGGDVPPGAPGGMPPGGMPSGPPPGAGPPPAPPYV